MKKLFALFLVVFMTLSVAACNKNKSVDQENTENDNMSGINSTVSKQETDKGSEYQFEGYFTTTVPSGITAEDISINADSALFNFSDSITLFDVGFAEQYETEDELKAEVEKIASTGSASVVDPITVNEISFSGVSLPDYGMTRYYGFINGYNVTISLYTEPENEAWKSFIATTVFTLQ